MSKVYDMYPETIIIYVFNKCNFFVNVQVFSHDCCNDNINLEFALLFFKLNKNHILL